MVGMGSARTISSLNHLYRSNILHRVQQKGLVGSSCGFGTTVRFLHVGQTYSTPKETIIHLNPRMIPR